MPDMKPLRPAELATATKILDISTGGSRVPADNLKHNLDMFLDAYEIVKAATEDGVDAGRARLKEM